MATAASGRVICSHCGANNFETQAACWKCGVPLSTSAAPALSPDKRSPLPVVADAPIASLVDPSAAHWVGIIGGLIIPIAMLPVGFAFLMWDERRKVEIGRTAVIASLIGMVIHGVITFYACYGLVQQGLKMMPGATARQQAAQSNAAPDLNAPAKPLELSGIPSLSPQR